MGAKKRLRNRQSNAQEAAATWNTSSSEFMLKYTATEVREMDINSGTSIKMTSIISDAVRSFELYLYFRLPAYYPLREIKRDERFVLLRINTYRN